MTNYLQNLQDLRSIKDEEVLEKLSLTPEEYELILTTPKNVTSKNLKDMSELFKVSISELIVELGLITAKDEIIIKKILANNLDNNPINNIAKTSTRLSELRTRNNFKQWEVAYALDMTRAGYNHYERRSGISPTIKKLHRISRLFGITMDTFLLTGESRFEIDKEYFTMKIMVEIFRTFLSIVEGKEGFRLQEKMFANKLESMEKIMTDYQVNTLDKLIQEHKLKTNPKESVEQITNIQLKYFNNRTKSTILTLYYSEVLTYDELLKTLFIRNRKIYGLDSRIYNLSIQNRLELFQRLHKKDSEEFKKKHSDVLSKLISYDKGNEEISSSYAIEMSNEFDISIDEVLGNPMIPMYFDREYLKTRIMKAINRTIKEEFSFKSNDFSKHVYLCTLIGKPVLRWSQELVNEKKFN